MFKRFLVFQSGASGAAAALIVIVLAFAMFRRSRRQNCLYHNKELEEVVPSLPYRKRNVDIETASINTFEFDVSVWMFIYRPAKCRVSNQLVIGSPASVTAPCPHLTARRIP